MRKQNVAMVFVCVTMLGFVAGYASAGSLVSVDVPFKFMVNDQEMQAGTYTIEPMGKNEAHLAIRSSKGGGPVMVTVIERLAQTGAKEPLVIFDKMQDGTSYLSEVHVPGSDGFLVGIAKGREQHVVVPGQEQH